MMNATYTRPACVFTYVRSASQSRFGASAVKARSTRSAGRSVPSSLIVVRTHEQPRRTPDSPRCRAQLLRGRADRFPLRPVLVLVIEHHPHRALTHLDRIPARPSLI